MGKDIRVKALVGLSAIKADANERDAPAEDRWYVNANLPKSSEASGMRLATLEEPCFHLH